MAWISGEEKISKYHFGFGWVEVNSSSSLALESDTFLEKGDHMVLLKARIS